MIRQSERKSPVYCNLGSAYLAVACNPGAVVIFHTPKACSHLALGSYWNIKRREFLRDPGMLVPKKNNLFVTGISDKEAIFGGEQILRQCLLDVIKMPDVEYIIVVPGCTSGVIGDDVIAIGKEIEEISKISVIVVPGAGFMSKHYIDNNIRMLEHLLERFAIPKQEKTEAKIAMIIGENAATGNEHNIHEVKRLLGYFGFQKVLFPPNATTKEEFSLIPEVELIIPVGISRDYFGKLQNYAQGLAVRYGAKCYPNNYPVGIDGTKQWLLELGKLLQCEKTAESAWEEEKKKIVAFLKAKDHLLVEKKYVFVIGYPRRYFDAEQHIKTLEVAGVTLKAVIFHNDLTSKEKEEHRKRLAEFTDVPCYEEQHLQEWIDKIDFTLTTTALIDIPHQLCLSVQQVGTWGVENLFKKVIATVADRGRRILYEY